jgi:hypothetical protein
MKCKLIKNRLLQIDKLPFDSAELPGELKEHLSHCPDCTSYYFQLLRTQIALQSLGDLQPPQPVLDYYLSDLNYKLQTETSQSSDKKSSWFAGFLQNYRFVFRPVAAVLAAVLIAIGIWLLDIHAPSNSEPDMMATDSLDFYLESFNEASAQNPVALVKGLEYNWAYYGTSDVEK